MRKTPNHLVDNSLSHLQRKSNDRLQYRTAFFQKRLNLPANQVFVWDVTTGKRVARLPGRFADRGGGRGFFTGRTDGRAGSRS